jgi:hypothetical protein
VQRSAGLQHFLEEPPGARSSPNCEKQEGSEQLIEELKVRRYLRRQGPEEASGNERSPPMKYKLKCAWAKMVTDDSLKELTSL